MVKRIPPFEIGFSLCRAQNGKLVKGPLAKGSANEVSVPVHCPEGSKFEGLFHTHPGGVASPSPQDIKSAVEVGANVLCIMNDSSLRCFRIVTK